jgi:hypothetical protein
MDEGEEGKTALPGRARAWRKGYGGRRDARAVLHGGSGMEGVTATVISWRRFLATVALSVLYGIYGLPGLGGGVALSVALLELQAQILTKPLAVRGFLERDAVSALNSLIGKHTSRSAPNSECQAAKF